MLSKKNKVTQKKDFDRIFKKGAVFKEEFLILKTIPNHSQTSRFSFIISKKVSKKATIRNKIRRRLKGLIKKQIDDIKKGIDGVFIVLPGIEDKNFQELKSILNNLFKKTNLI